MIHLRLCSNVNHEARNVLRLFLTPPGFVGILKLLNPPMIVVDLANSKRVPPLFTIRPLIREDSEV